MRLSTMARRVQCPASEKLEAKFPDTSSKAAERGTKLHEICEAIILNKEYPQVSKADMEQVRWATDSAKAKMEGASQVLTEVEIEVAGVKGHADLVILFENRAVVLDYKFGRHPISAVDNWQLKAYAVGVSRKFNIYRVEVGIIQPALQYREIVVYDKDDLDDFEAEIASVVELAKQDTTPIPGPECTWCKAREVCPSRVGVIAGLQTSVSLPHYFKSLTPAKRADFWEKVQVAKKWIAEVEGKIVELAKDNEIAGYEIGSGRRTRVWNLDEEELQKNLKDLGIDPYKKSLRTPADVLKENKQVESLTAWKEGNPTLKRSK